MHAPAGVAPDPATGEAGRPLLDRATLTDGAPRQSVRGSWVVNVHDGAGEASISWNAPKEEATDTDSDQDFPADLGPGEAADPERSAMESANRARRRMRRFCTTHKLDRLGTLTFRCRRCQRPGGCICPEGPDRPRHEDRDWVWGRIEEFRRAIYREVGKVALVLVIEDHADGHLHVHFAFGRYFDKRIMEKCWSHGWVDLRAIRQRGMRRATGLERFRIVASYLSKYLVKGAGEDGRPSGKRRYSVTTGITAPPRRARFLLQEEALTWLQRATGGQSPCHTWTSADLQDWDGPPVTCFFYEDELRE